MLKIFKPSSLGDLIAVFAKRPNSDCELVWYLTLNLTPMDTQKESYDYSILIEDILLSPTTCGRPRRNGI